MVAAMSADLDARSAAFWTWFAGREAGLRAEFLAAAHTKDYGVLQRLVDELGAALADVAAGLTLRLTGGEAGFRLAIQSPDPAGRELARQVIAAAPTLAGWQLGEAPDVPGQSIIVRDTEGRELVLAYADITFVILPRRADGTHNLLFTVPEDFDPRGERGHLYQAAATEIIKATFGAAPAELSSYAMIPARMITPRPLNPLTDLAAAWRARG